VPNGWGSWEQLWLELRCAQWVGFLGTVLVRV